MTGVDSSGKILKPSQLIKRVKEMTSNAAIEEHIKLRLFCLLSISLGELTYEDRQMLFSAQSFLNRNIEPPKVPSFAQVVYFPKKFCSTKPNKLIVRVSFTF